MTKLLAIDQGTTGSTAIVLTLEGEILAKKNVEFEQHFPKPGWVEHDAEQIWASVEAAVKGALEAAGVADGRGIGAIGITNQRETTLVWDRATGKPIHRAIVWQCRRTASECDRIKAEGAEPLVRKRTGLVVDAYFSGTKVAWLLDNVPGARGRADKGELAFGTIDSFLVHRLSGVHATDVTNASRTLLMDIEKLAWDDEMLRLFAVPASVLPKIVPSAGRIGVTKGVGFLPDGIPITGIAGDQQAALFGQACFAEGDAKCTYGTGAFALMNIGSKPTPSTHGLITTVGWKIGDTPVVYALEGSAFIAGAAVQWLRDGLGLIKTAPEIEALARKVESSEGVAFVPAFVGLGAPYWDQGARGLITGITRGTTAAHIARATLEGIAFEVLDLLTAMTKDAGHPLKALRIDGGAAKNDLLAQFQADIAQVLVVRPVEVESTGRGAAMLAGVGAELTDLAAAQKMVKLDRNFEPSIDGGVRDKHIARWKDAVGRSRSDSQVRIPK